MDFKDKILEISNRIKKLDNNSLTIEEATKNALIMPFILALNYDVFNPVEVIPEFGADVPGKNGEKVDYAIKRGEEILILIECKCANTKLTVKHTAQLYRYFNTTSARLGILTNGIQYKFYSDLVSINKMDETPFFEFDMTDIEDYQIDELKKFEKSKFSLNDILKNASTLKYTNSIKSILESELNNPSEDFVRFFATRVYEGRITQQVLEQLTSIVKEARIRFITDKVNKRLNSALTKPYESKEIIEETNSVITTQEEIDAYNIIKAISSEIINPARIFIRDRKRYCRILLDNNHNKTICILHFNTLQKHIEIITNDENQKKQAIDEINEIFAFSKKIKTIINEYENKN